MAKEPKNPPLEGLRERRLFRGITQTDMAETLELSQSHYRQFEIGKVRLDIYRAKLLADRLDCRIEDLL